MLILLTVYLPTLLHKLEKAIYTISHHPRIAGLWFYPCLLTALLVGLQGGPSIEMLAQGAIMAEN